MYSQQVNSAPYKLLKKLIWAYFLLLIFEGALRKWVLPALSTPLLIIRDPVALLAIIIAVRQGLLPANQYLKAMLIVGTIGIITAVSMGHGSLPVALYGARILMLHFSFIFVVGRIFNKEDVEKIGKATLLIAIPMTILVAMQFYSPQSAWVNRGVGGDLAGAGFSGALGFMRPPGTFSFTNGNTLFFSFVAVFVFYFWLYPQKVNKIILIAATVGLFAAIPLSISRTLLFQVCLTGLLTVLAVAKKPKFFSKIVFGVVGGAIAIFILGHYSFFQTATEAFTVRFEGANESEGGLKGVFGDRYVGGMIGGITGSTGLPFFGYGLGTGTSVGSTLLTGKAGLNIAEDEWARQIGELGPVLGITVIFIRLALCFKIAVVSFKRLKSGNLLPWLLLSFGLTNLPQGQWAQPTAMGFGIVIGGLMIASLRDADTSRKIERLPKKEEVSLQAQ